MESYVHPEAIVSTDWVSEHLEDPSIVVAEVNTDLAAAYNQGHIPNAVGWRLHTDLEHQVKRDLPGIAQIEQVLGRSGIDKETTVILYSDGNNRSATWAFWVLKYYRHDDIRIMNGGRQKWISECKPLSTIVETHTPKIYKALAPNHSLRAMKDYIVTSLTDRSVKILDTRAYEEYAGFLTSAPGTAEAEIYRKGRIPGAIHIPWDDGATDNGMFKPFEELLQLYSTKGINPSNEVIPYCRLGVRASYSWFVLKYLLGFPRVRNYDGSWTEWGNSSGVPIDTGAPEAEI